MKFITLIHPIEQLDPTEDFHEICYYLNSSALNNSTPTEDFHEICYLNIFRKTVDQIQVSLKPDKKNEQFPRRPMYMQCYVALEDIAVLSVSQDTQWQSEFCPIRNSSLSARRKMA